MTSFKFVFIQPRTKVFVIARKSYSVSVPSNVIALTARQIKTQPIKLSSVAENVNTVVAFYRQDDCKLEFVKMSTLDRESCECIETYIDDLQKFCNVTNLPMIAYYEQYEDRTDVYYYQKRDD